MQDLVSSFQGNHLMVIKLIFFSLLHIKPWWRGCSGRCQAGILPPGKTASAGVLHRQLWGRAVVAAFLEMGFLGGANRDGSSFVWQGETCKVCRTG